MKWIFKITAILIVVAVIFGCHEEPEPHAPTLIEPEDGAVFDTLLPENFIWSADGWKEEFYLYLAVGSVAETLIISGDTSFEFTPLVSLDGTIDGYYEWAVASIAEDEALWSDIHSFTINTQKYGPTLLSPDDSSVVYGQSLVFSWTSDRPADMYTLYILSDYLIFQNVSDTFYDLSSSEYSDLQAGDYTWYVTRHVNDWRFPSETRHFTIAEPIDLDTTYFPFGLGYEWKFERHDWGHNYNGEEPYKWHYIDTFIIKVVDTNWIVDTLSFTLSGGSFRWSGSPLKIWDDKTLIQADLLWFHHERIISIINPEPFSNDFGPNLKYYGDTLYIVGYDEDGFLPPVWGIESVSRIKGIGVIYQSKSEGDGDVFEQNYSDYLLYFYNGQDTVYESQLR